MEITQPHDLAEKLQSANPTPIAELDPELPDQLSKAVHGVVTITWPFNAVQNTFSFILAEPDFRLRLKKGQVRVNFSGAAAKELGTIGLSSTDEVTLSLDGAQWKSGKTSKRQSLPGSNLDWELNYSQRLVLLAKLSGATDTRLVTVDSPASLESDLTPHAIVSAERIIETEIPQVTPASTSPYPLSATPVKNPRVTELNETEFASPAFAKRARESLGSLFEDGYDIFEDDGGYLGRGRKKLRFSGRDSSAWRLGGHSPTPSPEPEREPEPELEPEHGAVQSLDKQPAFGAEQRPRSSTKDGMPEWSTQTIQGVTYDLPKATESYSAELSGPSGHPTEVLDPNSQIAGSAVAHDTQHFPQSGWSSEMPLSMPISAPAGVSPEPHALSNFKSNLELGMANSEIQQEWAPEPSGVYPEYPAPPNVAHPTNVGEPVGYGSSFNTQQSFESETVRPVSGDMDLYPEGATYDTAAPGSLDEEPQCDFIPYPQISQAYPPLEEVGVNGDTDHGMVSLESEHIAHAPGYPEPPDFQHTDPVPASLEPIHTDALASSWAAVNQPPPQNGVPRPARLNSASGDSAEEPLVIGDESDSDEETSPSLKAMRDGAAASPLYASSRHGGSDSQDEMDAEHSEDDEPEYDIDEAGGDYDTRNYRHPNDDEDDSHDEDLRPHTLESQFDEENSDEDEDEGEDEDEDDEMDQSDDQVIMEYDEDDVEDFESQGGYDDDEESENVDDEEEEEEEDEDDEEMEPQPTTRAPPSAPTFIDLISSSEDEEEDEDDIEQNQNSTETSTSAVNSSLPHQGDAISSQNTDEASLGDTEGAVESRTAAAHEDAGSDMEQSGSEGDVSDMQSQQDEISADDVDKNQQMSKIEPQEHEPMEDSKPDSVGLSATSEHSTDPKHQGSPAPVIDNNSADCPESHVEMSKVATSSLESPSQPISQDVETTKPITTEVNDLEQKQAESTTDAQTQNKMPEDEVVKEVELTAAEQSVEEEFTEQATPQEKHQLAPSSPPATQPQTSFMVEESVDIFMPDSGTEVEMRMSSEQLPTPFETQRAESIGSENNDLDQEKKDSDSHSPPPAQTDEPTPKTPRAYQSTSSQAMEDKGEQVLSNESNNHEPDEMGNQTNKDIENDDEPAEARSDDGLETSSKDQPNNYPIETPDRVTRSAGQPFEEPSSLLSFRSQMETDDELQASILHDSIHDFETPEKSLQSSVINSEVQPQSSGLKPSLPIEEFTMSGPHANQDMVSSPLSSVATPGSSRPRTRKGQRSARGSLTPSRRPGSSGTRSLAETESDSHLADASVWLARAANASKRPNSRGQQTSPTLHRPHTRSRDHRRSSTPMDGEDTSVRLARGSLGASALWTTLNVDEESPSVVTAKLDLARRLRDELHNTAPLADLRNHLGGTVDAIGVAMMKPPHPRRARTGPREYMMSFTMSDYSIGPNAVVEVLLYRRVKDSLPIIKPGNIVLLRKFKVLSIPNKDFGLQTGDESGWAVFDRGEEEPPQIRGPPVEVLDAEVEYAKSLRDWFDLLDDKQRAELDRANKRMVEAGSNSNKSSK